MSTPTQERPRFGSLFSGIGGLDLAIEEFFNAEIVWHAEFDPEPSKVLEARWPGVANLGDVTTVNWDEVEPVDGLCGGFPCQDLSLAGRRAGMRPGTRSGLWADFKAAIAALRPKVVVIENVRGLLSGCAESDSDLEPCPGCLGISNVHRPLVRALGRVLGDLAELGFDAEWQAVRASDVGAPHGRFRVFVVAYARGVRLGAWRHSAPGQTAGGRSSAIDRGRGGAPVALLGTPTTRDWKDGPEVVNVEVNGLLGRQVWSLLPTPMTSDANGASADHRRDHLPLRSSLLPTPRASRGAASTETMYALGAERTDDGDRQGNVVGEVNWGAYEPAIRRWEALTRPAPAPTLPDGKNDAHRLSPRLPEWMMGYPDGWVTDILERNAAIKACGNGVLPQQAVFAMSLLWPRILKALAVSSLGGTQ